MLNSEQNDEECDATKADSSNAAGYIKHLKRFRVKPGMTNNESRNDGRICV